MKSFIKSAFILLATAFVCVVLPSCGNKAETTPAAPDDEPLLDETIMIRVMQFNILQATGETAGHEWATVRKDPCIRMFYDTAPDIVAVQECRKSQCNDLATYLPQYTQIKHPKDNIESNGGQRNVILYKSKILELISWDKYWFSVDGTANGDRFGNNGGTTQKLTIYAKFKHKPSGKYFWFYCTHFFASSSLESRGECVKMSLDRVGKEVPEDGTVFFCGDLNLSYTNDEPRKTLSPIFDYFMWSAKEAPNTSGTARPTYNKFGASTNVLDYILYRNATPLNYVVVNSPTAYGTDYLSDHYPIYSDFLLDK